MNWQKIRTYPNTTWKIDKNLHNESSEINLKYDKKIHDKRKSTERNTPLMKS